MSLNQPNKAKPVLLESLAKTCFNSCNTEHFIYNGGCGISVLRCLKELAWVIKTVSVYYFIIYYPTRDLQRSYNIAINNFQLSEQF